ncbi:MAG: hypothetical protein QE278_08885 [Limnobacter sp.]|nr:hypothetical protein [Limnobacter sp.]
MSNYFLSLLTSLKLADILGELDAQDGGATGESYAAFLVEIRGNFVMSEDKELRSIEVSNIDAAKVAVAMAAAIIIIPTLLAFGNSVDDIGGYFAQKLIAGLFLFPILFLIAKYVVKPKKRTNLSSETGALVEERDISKWNYFGVIVGPIMLVLIFVPDFLEGKVGVNYWLGVIFWIVVIFFSAKNILKTRRR